MTNTPSGFDSYSNPENGPGTPSAAPPAASIIPPPAMPPLPYPSSTTAPFYWVKYSPSAASRFAIRGWVSAVFWLAVGAWLAVYLPSIINNEPWVGYAAAASVLIPVWISIHHAVRSRTKWGADDGLVFALSDRGVSLPLVGEVPWSDVVGVQRFDMSGITANVFISLFESWLGSRNDGYMVIYTRHTLGDVAVAPADIRRRMVPNPDSREPLTYGFVTAYKAGLKGELWYLASDELVAAANARNIPVRSALLRPGWRSGMKRA